MEGKNQIVNKNAVTMLKAVCIPIPDDDNDKGYK